jgi:hypothetical protein
VKGIAIFTLSLVSVEERRSYPLQVKQVVRTEAEKAAAKASKKKKPAKKGQTAPKKPGRPKGSQNRDKTQVELTAELIRIQQMVKNQLAALQHLVTIRYLALMGTLATTMPCKWFGGVTWSSSPSCVTMLPCTSSTTVSKNARDHARSMVRRSTIKGSLNSTCLSKAPKAISVFASTKL